MPDVYLCCLAHQAHKVAPPGWGLALLFTYQHSMGQAVDCSAAGADAWGERGYGDGSSLTLLSSIVLLSWLPGFPPQALPATVSCLSPLGPSPSSQQQPLPWGCSRIPVLQLPSAVPCRGRTFLSGVLKREFIGPGLHLRPVHADHARPPLQWTLNSVFSAYGNNRSIRPPPDRP